MRQRVMNVEESGATHPVGPSPTHDKTSTLGLPRPPSLSLSLSLSPALIRQPGS